MLNNISYSANNVCKVWTNELPRHMQQGGLVHFLSFSNFLGKVNFRKLVLRALIAILIKGLDFYFFHIIDIFYFLYDYIS